MRRRVRLLREIPIPVSAWVPPKLPEGATSYAEACELARTAPVPSDYAGGRPQWLEHLAIWARDVAARPCGHEDGANDPAVTEDNNG